MWPGLCSARTALRGGPSPSGWLPLTPWWCSLPTCAAGWGAPSTFPQPPGSLFTLHSGARKSPAVCVIKTKRGWCLRSAYHLREPLSSAFYAFFSELHVDSLSRGLIVPLNKGCGCWVLGWLHNFLPAEP